MAVLTSLFWITESGDAHGRTSPNAVGVFPIAFQHKEMQRAELYLPAWRAMGACITFALVGSGVHMCQTRKPYTPNVSPLLLLIIPQ